MKTQIITGDCLDVMQLLDDCSVDAIVTDPPYGLSFMGKAWDHSVPSVEVWREALRVLKPGGHMLAFFGTRTYHRGAVAIEDAGFEIRDQIGWAYGSGFPKSLDVSKAIDKAAGAEREVVGPGRWNHVKGDNAAQAGCLIRPGGKHAETAPATEAARQWQGWGTAMKPAWEPIVVARKPLLKGYTVAANVLAYGTGALNIDGCRVPTDDDLNGGAYSAERKPSESEWVKHGGTIHSSTGQEFVQPAGRWPANLITDGSDEVVALFPQSKDGDAGSAARFFYCAKASKKDRGEGNDHQTVKPTDLMRYLCRLVTPPGGVVLDPFAGSGSTCKAAVLEGFEAIGIEMDPHNADIARRRCAAATPARLAA